MSYIKHITKYYPGSETTATILTDADGMYRVTVVHRFDSGIFIREPNHNNLSLTAAEGLLAYYTA